MIDLLIRVGENDCELLGDGALAQPVNTVTSLAYVVAGGLLIWKRPRDSASTPLAVGLAVMLALIGVGSVVYHGPQGWGAQWIHDVPIAATLAAVPAWNLAQLGRITDSAAFVGWLAATVVIGVASAIWPNAIIVLGVVAGTAAVVTEVMVRRKLRVWAPALAIGMLGTVFNLLGRTNSPVCEPESVFQLHGVWHILTAIAIFLWGWGAFADRRQAERVEVAV